MKSNKLYKKLEVIVENTLEEMIDTIIIKVGGQYVLFNRYSITRYDGYVVVFRRRDAESFEFTQIKHALVWVILDKHNKYKERDQILRLDRDLTSTKTSQQIHKKLRTKHQLDSDLRPLYSMKLQLDRDKEKRIVAEIDKYITMANKYHLQGTKK